MADITNEEVLLGGTDYGYSPVVTSYGEGVENYREQQESILNTSTEMYSNSMVKNALKSNTLAKAFGYVADEYLTGYPAEEGYEIDDEETIRVLQDNNLSYKYGEEIRNVKSRAEFIYKLGKANRESKIDEQINNTLDSVDRVSSSVGGALLDVDLLLGIGVGMMYSKSASMSKVMTMEAAAETTISSAHYMFDEDYTVADGIIDGMFGLGIAYTATKAFRHFDTDVDVVHGKVDYTKDANIVGEARGKPFEAERSVDGVVDIIAKEGAIEPQTIVGATRHRMEANDTVLKEFGDVKYDTYKQNRKSFFSEQDKIVKGTRAKNVSDIETKLATEKAALAKADTPKKKAIRDNRITKLEEDLTGAKQALGEQELSSINGKTPDEIRFNNMVDEISVSMKETVDDMNMNIKNNDTKWMEENKNVVDSLSEKYPAEFSDLKNLIQSKLGSAKDLQNKEVKVGGRVLTNKEKAFIAGAILLSGSSLQAGEGDIAEELTIGVLAIAGIALFGSKTMALLKNPNTRNTAKVKYNQAKSWMNKTAIKNSPEGEEVTRRREDIANSIKTRWTSTIAPFEKAGGEIKDLAEKLVYSAKEGAGVEVVKRRRIEGSLSRYMKDEKFQIKQFKKELANNQTPNTYADLEAERNFRHLVADYIEDIEIDGTYPKSVQDFAKTVRAEFKDMYGYNIENGTYGFVPRKLKDGTMSKPLEYKDNMLPRLWKKDVHDWMKKLSDEDIDKVKGAVFQAIKSKLKEPTQQAIDGASNTADKFVKRWVTGSKAKEIGDDTKGSMFNTIKHLMEDDVEIEDYLDALNVKKDKSARAKHRVNMDMEVFAKELEDVAVTIDGVKTPLKKTHFVDRNIRSIFDTTSHNLYASGSLSSAGFKSVKQLERTIENLSETVKDKGLIEDLENVKDLIVGTPVGNNSSMIQEVSLIAKDLTMMTKLPFAVFSTPQEIVNMVGNHGVGKSLKSLGTLLDNQFGKESYMMNQLMDTYGIGTNVRRTDFSFYGINDDLLALEDNGVTNMFRRGTMKMRDAVLLPLGGMTDVIQRMNAVMDTEKFAKLINGIDKAEAYRWDGVGINDDVLAMFKDTFEFNANGSLKDFNINTWSAKKQDVFGEILFSMEQRTTLTNTIGETPLFSKTDSLGRVMTTLLGYSLSQFNAHTVEGVRHLDRTFAMHTMGGFMGSYLGLHARYAVQDKEVSEEDIITYSILNTPALSPIALIQGGGDPVVFDTVSEITKVPSTIIGAVQYD